MTSSLFKSAKARKALPVLALALAALATGCANRPQSIIVGSIPDDYRTNHPIVIEERQKKIDIPVGLADHGMTRLQAAALDGFLQDYDPKGGTAVAVLVPYGSINQAAASRVAADMVTFMHKQGVPQGYVVHQPYQAPADATAPIRVTYGHMRAATASNCGRWPKDLLDNNDNKHWANFGCASQNNLAAQLANPADLLAPRHTTSIDAENRSNAIDQYRAREVSPEFRNNSEIGY